MMGETHGTETQVSSMADTKPADALQDREEEKGDDDLPKLSPYALAALREFLAEQTSSAAAMERESEGKEAVQLLPEDWRLSQFWYSLETAQTVADEVSSLLTHFSDDALRSPPSVACIACPTLFAYLKKMYPDVRAQILEYDRRFEQYGSDFTFYDYNLPEELPQAMKHAYQIIVADPPYLSGECLEKVSQTIAFLAQRGKSLVLLLTGAVQKDKAATLLGLRPCGFQPQHTSKLGNEFRLFTNYDPGNRVGGWELEK